MPSKMARRFPPWIFYMLEGVDRKSATSEDGPTVGFARQSKGSKPVNETDTRADIFPPADSPVKISTREGGGVPLACCCWKDIRSPYINRSTVRRDGKLDTRVMLWRRRGHCLSWPLCRVHCVDILSHGDGGCQTVETHREFHS